MEYRSNSILVYIPVNEAGKQTLEQILFFHESLGMRVFILNTIKKSSGIRRKAAEIKTEQRQKEALDKLHQFVNNEIGKEVPKEIILKIKPGKLSKILFNEALKGGYEFIAVDKNALPEFGPSTAELNRLISISECPVLVLNNQFPVEKVKTIAIPIDISQTTKKRLYWATFFAKKMKASIQIVSVLNVNMEETKSLAYRNAEKIKQMLEKRSVKADVKIIKKGDQPNHQILLDYFEKSKPDLVIIRTHQEYQFSGKKIGRFVSEIVHKCKVPVFTVGGKTKDFPI